MWINWKKSLNAIIFNWSVSNLHLVYLLCPERDVPFPPLAYPTRKTNTNFRSNYFFSMNLMRNKKNWITKFPFFVWLKKNLWRKKNWTSIGKSSTLYCDRCNNISLAYAKSTKWKSQCAKNKAITKTDRWVYLIFVVDNGKHRAFCVKKVHVHINDTICFSRSILRAKSIRKLTQTKAIKIRYSAHCTRKKVYRK